ncbi:MAG TPA: FkbM family methyltransferase [Planctomycetota bacterium]|nr:FkbM family methyltransferase [Planctomycetota bacterium]
MNQVELCRAIDAIATCDPETRGYGYADTQYAWHHDAAIEQPRRAFHAWLQLLHRHAADGAVLQVGLDRRGGSHLALLAVAARVVGVDGDGARVEAARRLLGPASSRSVLLAGDPCAAAVAANVRDVLPVCDALLLDGDDGYERLRSAWHRYAGLVREGGLVAIVDRCQADAPAGRPFDRDRFVCDLERDFLLPRGVRFVRHGDAQALHSYVQTAATRAEVRAPALPAGFRADPDPEPLGTEGPFALWSWLGRVVAVPAAAGPLRARVWRQNGYDTVLEAADEAGARRLAGAWTDARPPLAQARSLLQQGAVEAARSTVAAVRARHAWLAAALVPCLEAAPWNRQLLLALGTLWSFGDAPRQGSALLRRALDLDMLDTDLLRTVAAACVHLLRDEAEARALLAAAKQHVRRRKVAAICHEELHGHALWDYPQLLAEVRGVLEVGAHRGEHVAAFARLEFAEQCHVEADPAAFAALERACAAAGSGRAIALRCAVGAAPRLTLDTLVAEGRIDAQRYDLLVVDTGGTELDVLRGATALLRHVDIVCVAVFLEPGRAEAPLPQQIQAFLRDLHGGDGFDLRAFEPSLDGRRGHAIFERKRARGSR